MATGIEGKLADMEIGNSMSIQIQTVIVSVLLEVGRLVPKVVPAIRRTRKSGLPARTLFLR